MKLVKQIIRLWWLLLIALVCIVISLWVPQMLLVFLRPGTDIDLTLQQLGSDTLTLMGFIIASLAVIANKIDNRAFDSERDTEGFKDVYRVLGLTAFVLFGFSMTARVIAVFMVPDWFTLIASFLFSFGMILLLLSVILLLNVISIINQARVRTLVNEEPAEPNL